MPSHIFFFDDHGQQSSKNYTMEAEVEKDGTIISVLVYWPFFSDWIDCTQKIENLDTWRKTIKQAAADHDWTEQEDEMRYG